MMGMGISKNTQEAMKTLLEQGKRFDGRKCVDYRDISVTYNVSNAAEGSARVMMGKTEVIAGVKLTLDKPYPDSPDKGNLMVSGDLLPLASPRYEVGPPKFDAIELPRLVDRSIRESHVIELDKLVVKAGEKVWTVIIDIYPINDDGNLVDAAVCAAIAALRQAKMPGITEAGFPDYKNRTKQGLPLAKEVIPLSVTIFKLGNALFVDPTREEAEAAEVKCNFGLTKQGKKYMVHSTQKTGAKPFTQKELETSAVLIGEKYDELYDKLKKVL
ncbi:exosome complex protein Rrp42 [Candidatus Pacearchaeota archaeon]|nr:exosome complex protein Rrp42 [Candidatus Pacearchaeota archaeon]